MDVADNVLLANELFAFFQNVLGGGVEREEENCFMPYGHIYY